MDRKKMQQNHNRLLLGEREAVLQEARTRGGIYIDLHPQALNMLQAANIDPYLIHEQGMRKQIEAKISRIDFVQANVDEMFEEWKSKPEGQAPIYVRLIFWLKNNARSYGYEQTGNSWILKQ
jgi:hypothetical protein